MSSHPTSGPQRHLRGPASRRQFLVSTWSALGVLACGIHPAARAAVSTPHTPRFPIIGFSKPFQSLDPEQTSDLVTRVGWDGIEIPLRPKGQVEPERAPDDLPRFAEALRRSGRAIHLAATDITSLKTPHAETVLRTLSRLGIRRLRLGFFQYPADRSPADHLKDLAPALRDIADACRDLGLQAGFQNHSGDRQVGAPIWDVYSLLKDLDPRHIGFCFDIGHATIEGGLSWPIDARVAEPFLTAVLVKDFVWKKGNARWQESWCPLGEGMVNRSFFEWLKKTRFQGPICQHHEYPLGPGDEMISSFQRDLGVLRQWLQ
ncbi:MAG: sugar phosphate isomerase/epimerase [Verrucomicrobiales bacterium]|nr:sugar phosphate isomerase/epimerase [Verrucomicrobiales bacterium]